MNVPRAGRVASAVTHELLNELSAYHERHIKQGALGAFMRAIDEGRIAPGSVLIAKPPAPYRSSEFGERGAGLISREQQLPLKRV